MAEPEKQETQPTDPPPDDPPLTNPQPADADAMEAEGRRSAPPRRQAQEINRQRAKESLAGMVELPGGGWILQAHAPVGESPPDAHQGDIPPDMPSAAPAETTSATKAWADKRPDMPSDTPPPASSADPLAARIAELMAQGWALPNATARARSEAMPYAKPGARP